MNFFQRMRAGLERFFINRNGADHLANFTLFLSLVVCLLDLFLRTGILGYVGMALYAYTIFRLLSKNKAQRMAENQKFLSLTGNIRTKFRQFIQRQKNRKQYKYFRCPKCRALLRLTRGCGQVNVTCARCKHEFSQKA